MSVASRGLMGAMTENEAIAILDAINYDDGEPAHCEADEVLLAIVPPAVREAYERAQERAPYWAFA